MLDRVMRQKRAILLGILAAWPLARVWADEPAPDSRGIRWQEAKPGQTLILTHDQVVRMKAVMDAEDAELKPLWDRQTELKAEYKRRLLSFGNPQNKAQAEQERMVMRNDPTLRSMQDEIKSISKKMNEVRESYQSQKEAVLTPVQLAHYLKRKEEARQKQKK